jgi:hypothetical protein
MYWYKRFNVAKIYVSDKGPHSEKSVALLKEPEALRE